MKELPIGFQSILDDLGIDLGSGELLLRALTHASWAHEQGEPATEDNERLEFLGDAVVGLAVSEHLYTRFPDLSEGDLARMRAAVVREGSLAAAARRLGLGAALRMGRGAERTGGRQRDSVLADAFEAVMGAVYLTCGWQPAQRVVLAALGQELSDVARTRAPADAKSALQELLQAEAGGLPSYRVVLESGPPHEKQFEAEVLYRGKVLGRGSGRSKRAAEQAAAAQALQRLGEGLPRT